MRWRPKQEEPKLINSFWRTSVRWDLYGHKSEGRHVCYGRFLWFRMDESALFNAFHPEREVDLELLGSGQFQAGDRRVT